jgi:hypothetical protein
VIHLFYFILVFLSCMNQFFLPFPKKENIFLFFFALFFWDVSPPNLVGKGGHIRFLRGGRRGFNPRHLRVSDKNVPAFRRWRFEMKLSDLVPFWESVKLFCFSYNCFAAIFIIEKSSQKKNLWPKAKELTNRILHPLPAPRPRSPGAPRKMLHRSGRGTAPGLSSTAHQLEVAGIHCAECKRTL